jgi:ferrous iron transport protein A
LSNTVITLDTLPIGHSARIQTIHFSGPFRRRLVEMGLQPGEWITALRAAPLGDPIAYRIKGSQILLRRSEAQYIELVVQS